MEGWSYWVSLSRSTTDPVNWGRQTELPSSHNDHFFTQTQTDTMGGNCHSVVGSGRQEVKWDQCFVLSHISFIVYRGFIWIDTYYNQNGLPHIYIHVCFSTRLHRKTSCAVKNIIKSTTKYTSFSTFIFNDSCMLTHSDILQDKSSDVTLGLAEW